MTRVACLLAIFLAGFLIPVRADEVLDLAGIWKVRLDAGDQGLAQAWAAEPIASETSIALPGTTDLAGLGPEIDTRTFRYPTEFPPTTRFPGVQETGRADERGYLVRRHLHVGPAWYERSCEVPSEWAGRPVRLRLERALWKTDVWIDGRHQGSCDSLVAEHRYELGPLVPGVHRLTVRVDNRMIHNLSTVTHAYGPETQSRWNGLIGDLRLEVSDSLSLDSLRAFPAADRRSVRLEARWNNLGPDPRPYRLQLRFVDSGSGLTLAELSTNGVVSAGVSPTSATLRFAEPATAWSEFHPARHRLEANVVPEGSRPSTHILHFGFRQVERRGRELHLDGRPIFLRGTLDCAVYPRTGHPPMTVPEWERTFRVVKDHGFNHVRFHTWCPPEAAFEAADRLGLYLQAEAPAWVDDWGLDTETRPPAIGRDPQVTAFLRAELRRMSEAYGNHPSFLMCAIGNEFGMNGTDWDRVNAMVDEIKAYDPRRLYAGCGARKNLPADDFWFTHQTGAGTRGVGPAHTDWDFARAVETSPAPVIAHETGQRPVYPNFPELLPKFTGPLLPANLERHHRSP